MEAFDQQHCPATYPTPSISHPNATLEPVHNDALVYLAVAVATFAAVPSFLWLRDRRRKSRERRRNRVVVESIKAKMDAARALEVNSPPPAPAAEPSVVDEQDHEERDVEDGKEKKKRSKDRRKRGREPSRSVRSNKSLTTSKAPSARRELPPTEYTPRAPEQSRFSPPPMPDIASPMPVSLISTSFNPSSSSPSHSETSSQPGPSRSASASSTTAPLTPPSLPPSQSLPPFVKTDDAETWAPRFPHDDPAWDWDGQSSTYSSGSRAPSSSRTKFRQRDEFQTSPSPPSPSMPSVPSLVFPSLNAHPPPGASLSTQIASLKGALEASRTREEMNRRDAERWSKECDLVKWRWNEASDMWRRREAELQTQLHHLTRQVQTLTHTMQAACLSPPIGPLSFGPGQPPFPLAMPFPSPNNPASPFPGNGIHSFDHRSPSALSHTNGSDIVNEGLAEAILKRPGNIRSSTSASSSRSGTRRGETSQEEHLYASATPEKIEPTIEPEKAGAEEIIEFEFPTLLERPVSSPPRTDPARQMIASLNSVEIFN